MSKSDPTFAVTSSTSVRVSMLTIHLLEKLQETPNDARLGLEQRLHGSLFKGLLCDYQRSKYTNMSLVMPCRPCSNLATDSGYLVVIVSRSGSHIHRRAEEKLVCSPHVWISASSRLIGLACSFLADLKPPARRVCFRLEDGFFR